jgi:hypothetical protein
MYYFIIFIPTLASGMHRRSKLKEPAHPHRPDAQSVCAWQGCKSAPLPEDAGQDEAPVPVVPPAPSVGLSVGLSVDGVDGVDGEGDPAGVGDDAEEEEGEGFPEEGEEEEEEEEDEDDGEGDESPSSPPGRAGRERVTRNVSPLRAAAPSSIDRAPCAAVTHSGDAQR